MEDDSIVAIATPIGSGGIGIVRISGKDALKIVKNFISSKKDLKSHVASLLKIINPDDNEIIDSSLVIYMKNPKSFTGEDVIEIHCHGNPYILNRVVDLAIKFGARLALAGEFTKRAFINGKIDLTQAEAVYDLISSKTSVSLKNANNQFEGKLSKQINHLRNELVKSLSHIEAIIDYPDEIDNQPLSYFAPTVEQSLDLVNKLIRSAELGQLYREGVNIAIVGEPNVGKSSLLNSLLRFDRAIVTDIPGTTRDTLNEYINIKGIPVNIVDTAGIRDTNNKIEKIGIEKSLESIEKSQLVLLVISAENKLSEKDKDLIDSLEEKQKNFILVINKIDLSDNLGIKDKIKNKVFISAKYERGIEKLEKTIFEILIKEKTDSSLEVNINNRHKEVLYRVKESLDRALETTVNELPVDFLAIDIKDSIVNMGEIIGEDVNEEVINEIFANFCVGK